MKLRIKPVVFAVPVLAATAVGSWRFGQSEVGQAFFAHLASALVAASDAAARLVGSSRPAMAAAIVAVFVMGAMFGFLLARRGGDPAPTAQVAAVSDAAVDHGAEEKRVADARRKLETEMNAILSIVQSYLDQGKSWSAALARSKSALSAPKDPEQVRIAVLALIKEHQQMLQEMENYRRKLDESRNRIASLHSALTQTQEISARDALTGVFARGHFDAVLARETAQAKRDASDLCLVMIDVDHFKTFNDAHGHLIGDEVLKEVARLLTRTARADDIVARFGGEEFVILMPKTATTRAAGVAEQIRSRLEGSRWMVKGGQKVLVTASFGVAGLRKADSAQALIERADARLYKAKNAGRNRVCSDDRAPANAAQTGPERLARDFG